MTKKKTHEPIAKLTGNIIEHMRLMSDLEIQKSKHFHWDSKLWRAIDDAVSYHDDLVAHPKDYLIMSYRGTGRAVRLTDVCLYNRNYTTNPPKEHSVVGIEIEVEYIHEDQNGYDNPDKIRKTYRLQPPMELFVKFSKIKFNNWVKKVKSERDAETKKEDLIKLKELQEQYPDA